MNTAQKIAAGVGALTALSVAGAAHAQASATASATGTATIIQAIAISNTTGLGFGTIVKPNNASTGTVSVGATDGARTVTGVANANGNTGVSRALFTVVGEGGSAVQFGVNSTFNMTSSNGTLVVTTSTTGSTLTLSGSLGSSSTATFGVGGTFNLTSSTPSGSYSGTFVATVNYQ